MTSITLQTASPREVTVLTNDFIDNYMPRANGEFVKVYIHLLRLLSDGTTPFSLEQMADHFFCTERDILRALKYWEKEKLLILNCQDSGEISCITLTEPKKQNKNDKLEKDRNAPVFFLFLIHHIISSILMYKKYTYSNTIFLYHTSFIIIIIA